MDGGGAGANEERNEEEVVVTIWSGSLRTHSNRSRRLSLCLLQTSEDIGGKQDNCFDETENPFDSDAGQTEWKQKEPYKGIQNQSCQRQRPTKKKKYEPQKKFCHAIPFFLITIHPASGCILPPLCAQSLVDRLHFFTYY